MRLLSPPLNGTFLQRQASLMTVQRNVDTWEKSNVTVIVDHSKWAPKFDIEAHRRWPWGHIADDPVDAGFSHRGFDSLSSA